MTVSDRWLHPQKKYIQKLSLINITLFNSQNAGNYDSENLVFHIFQFYTEARPDTPKITVILAMKTGKRLTFIRMHRREKLR